MPQDVGRIFGQMARRIDSLEREVRALRKAPPSVTPSRPHPQLTEDFVGGSDVTGNIGELGWTLGGGTITRRAAPAGHPGTIELGTGAVAGTLASLHVGASTTVGVIPTADTWTARFTFRLGTTVDADTMVRVGLGLSPQANPPVNGAYIEKLLADTTFYGVARAASVQTRSQILTTAGAAMTALAANTYFRVRIRRLSATSAGFTVEALGTTAGTGITASYPEVVIAANVPTTANALQLFWQVQNGAAAANRFVQPDYAELQLVNLVR